MAQIWNRHTDNLFSRFLHLEHAQDAQEHTEQPTTQLGSVSFVDAVTGEVEASVCQQINKAFCGLLERRVNTGISNSEFGHVSVIFGGIKLLL